LEPKFVNRTDQIADVPVVQAEGGVLLGPLSEEGAATVRGWLDRGRTEEQ
jgi:hypothetical protein